MKESESSTVTCFVNLDSKISWRGKEFQIVTGTCSYYTSTWMICPCACAGMQRFGWDIDKIENVHPIYRVWYHPLWNEALKNLQLGDYKDSPFYSSPFRLLIALDHYHSPQLTQISMQAPQLLTRQETVT